MERWKPSPSIVFGTACSEWLPKSQQMRLQALMRAREQQIPRIMATRVTYLTRALLRRSLSDKPKQSCINDLVSKRDIKIYRLKHLNWIPCTAKFSTFCQMVYETTHRSRKNLDYFVTRRLSWLEHASLVEQIPSGRCGRYLLHPKLRLAFEPEAGCQSAQWSFKKADSFFNGKGFP